MSKSEVKISQMGGLFKVRQAFACMLSCAQLCVTPRAVAHQAPLSMAFPRQECWSGCHFLLRGILPLLHCQVDSWTLCRLRRHLGWSKNFPLASLSGLSSKSVFPWTLCHSSPDPGWGPATSSWSCQPPAWPPENKGTTLRPPREGPKYRKPSYVTCRIIHTIPKHPGRMPAATQTQVSELVHQRTLIW